MISDEQEKSLEGLSHCMEHGDWEDALFCLGDLFKSVLLKLNTQLVDEGCNKIFTPIGAINHYFFGKKDGR